MSYLGNFEAQEHVGRSTQNALQKVYRLADFSRIVKIFDQTEMVEPTFEDCKPGGEAMEKLTRYAEAYFIVSDFKDRIIESETERTKAGMRRAAIIEKVVRAKVHGQSWQRSRNLRDVT